MAYSEVETKVRNFAICHGFKCQVETDSKKYHYDIYLEKDCLRMGIRIQFQTISICKVDVVSENLNYMLRKINDKLDEINKRSIEE